MRKRGLIYGVGVNDADYVVFRPVDGKTSWCPYFTVWRNMLKRCYSKEYQQAKSSYKGCRVAKEWHSFMRFRAWMLTQDWEGNQLDKDIVGDGKLYSPETCVFIPQALNSFTIDSAASRGAWPIGVSLDKGKFQADISFNGKRKKLGRFNTALEAHLAWAQAKAALAINWIARMTDQRIKDGLQRYILNLIEGTLAIK